MQSAYSFTVSMEVLLKKALPVKYKKKPYWLKYCPFDLGRKRRAFSLDLKKKNDSVCCPKPYAPEVGSVNNGLPRTRGHKKRTNRCRNVLFE